MSSNNPNAGKVRRLIVFFFLVYVAEGMSMDTGIIAQPLSFYLKTSLGWTADQVAAYLTILTLPWLIKPLYGLLSDFVPLFGYRRKSWLFVANIVCSASFVWMMGLTSPSVIIISLFLGSAGMAASSALCQAVMVEAGKETGQSGSFVNHQWMWFQVALIVAAVGGGWLCQQYLNSPVTAFHYAALVAAIVPVGAFVGCWFLVDEQKTTASEQRAASWIGLKSAVKSPTLWLVAIFLALFNFNPSNGQPLYYYQTDHLHFSQEFIGILAGIGAAGAVVGSLVYIWWLQHERTPQFIQKVSRYMGIAWFYRQLGTLLAKPCRAIGWQSGEQFFVRLSGELEEMTLMKALVYLSIVLGIVAQAAMALMVGEVSAVILSITTQVATQVTVVTLLTLAAHACPDDAEGFSYAFILSIYNIGGQLGSYAGASLYEHWLGHSYPMLALISAAFTAVCFLVAPLLPRESLEDKGPE